MGEFSNFFKFLIQALEDSKINYVIIGGLVSIHFGRPRLTQDIDVIVKGDENEIRNLAWHLEERNFEFDEEDLVRNIIRLKTHSTIFHKDFPILHADIKGIYSELDQEVMNGKTREKIFGIDTWLESIEDNIVAKLVYGSQQDLEDALSVLIAQEERINISSLVEKSKRFKVSDKLKLIIEEKNKII
jgi:hypothetical protein